MKLLITICARGGSKGIPGKNIKHIAGQPLIYYTLRISEALKTILDGSVHVCLSTDSQDIKSVVANSPYQQIDIDYNRPKELATDSAGKMGVISDALDYMEKKNTVKYDYIIDLDVTSPLRTTKDIENAMSKIESKPDALNLFSVNPANRNPYFNMVEYQVDSEFVKLSKTGNFVTRQSAPQVFDVNASFYIYRRKFFEEGNKSAMTDKTLIYEMPHICFDLDHPIDFEFMSFLLEKKKLSFDFLY